MLEGIPILLVIVAIYVVAKIADWRNNQYRKKHYKVPDKI